MMENDFETAKMMASLIEGLTFNELVALNRLTAERIRLMQKAHALMAMSQFGVGDRVSWYSQDGNKYTGVIIRINHKTASVKVSEGGYWNVSPQLLQKE